MFDLLVSAQGKEANVRRQQRQQHYQTGGGRVIQASVSLFYGFSVIQRVRSSFVDLIAGISEQSGKVFGMRWHGGRKPPLVWLLKTKSA